MSRAERAPDDVVAWRPERVPGIAEVLHARFGTHRYPVHAHATWTLLIVDDGAVRYDLDRRPHGTEEAPVTLLPPGVAHDGRAASGAGFRKRVLYLEPGLLGHHGIGPAVDHPGVRDPVLRRRLDELHRVLTASGTDLHAESRLALVTERLARHLAPAGTPDPGPPGDGLAGRLRDLLDARTADGITLDEAGRLLHAHPGHLVRAFSRRFGLPPHRYLDARRVERARGLLLDGMAPATAAVTAGFHDQAHLHRRFVRLLGVTPGRYSRSRPGAPATR
ncbi:MULTISPECIES: AraC family transcriptional regulator [unclassified Pseudonocardia]|uniref:AraC family transcriptional regulator n=1 Tax=unclassified Pseudonocardia TaxID=2619320 RepID=UPI0001FFEC4F|nr:MULTISPECIES: AraC family transcriptional regulator [unclassified Pseudonocardia]ALE73858.1 AraC family transcriptional regulator [Pseudonocardia sp. EC080625-04]ALL77250.1 AraC family transcriptional regulator [Pseudonocardia sp. EC080610-09]ALL80166.1 AraC family transcriptional regulator [Pseudonocardia sp. EC080619-01]OLL77576.1 Transcriptional regulator, AraC family [Pseudonocardia sp. Ae150A_Ps1]OLL88308.1 Transcriptional regulator, AraC family [Pseudonocardia sp. Ae263_Ps1]